MPERVGKTKCKGGGSRTKFEGGYAGEGKEDKIWEVLAGKKNLGGIDHKQKLGGGAVENYVFLRGVRY